MRNAKQRSRNWCFTLNNYTSEEEANIKTIDCKYLVFGHEEAPSTGTKHLQGYVSFSAPECFGYVKARFPQRTHVEPARGTSDENRKYCTKGADIFERGAIPKDPAKSQFTGDNWDEAKALARAGKMDEIPSAIYIRYKRAFDSLRTEYLQSQGIPNLPDVCGVWFWGVSGAGKTWHSREVFGNPPISYLKGANKWWDGYRDQANVILDDFSPKHAEFLTYFIKIWADIYPFSAETKFGHIFIRPKQFVITSQYSIDECWPDAQDNEAMKRRFKRVEHWAVKFGDILPRAKPAAGSEPANGNLHPRM